MRERKKICYPRDALQCAAFLLLLLWRSSACVLLFAARVEATAFRDSFFPLAAAAAAARARMPGRCAGRTLASAHVSAISLIWGQSVTLSARTACCARARAFQLSVIFSHLIRLLVVVV